ncbi:MAG: hypothetical protein HY859_19295 [Caulobacterales bacterium]|nr:hypothetical protein [Caulobacterales bacterium]
MKFRVEYIFEGGRSVIARQLGSEPFVLSAGSKLGEIAVKARVSQPRALLPDGTPDLSLFVFELCRPADKETLAIGQVVELIA